MRLCIAPVLCTLLLTAGSMEVAQARGAVEYIAPSLRTAAYTCDDGGHGFAAVDSSEADWFSSEWRAAEEPSLYEQSITPSGSIAKSYRFTWLRSFHAPVFVRVDEDAIGEMRLVAKRLSGRGGYKPGRIAATVSRALTMAEKDRLRQALTSANVAHLDPINCAIGTDGAQWIFEVRDGASYRFVNRWSPPSGPVRQLGELLVSFTGWKIEPVY